MFMKPFLKWYVTDLLTIYLRVLSLSKRSVKWCVFATTELKYVQVIVSLRIITDCTLYHVVGIVLFNSSPNRKLKYYHGCTVHKVYTTSGYLCQLNINLQWGKMYTTSQLTLSPGGNWNLYLKFEIFPSRTLTTCVLLWFLLPWPNKCSDDIIFRNVL